jgi:uncharacterized protein
MSAEQMSNGIPMRTLGETGEQVTIIGVGGWHIGKIDPDLGVRIIRTAIDEGINFMDNAWCYNDGNSERVMGRALRDGYRDKVFLMTKNHGRDGETFVKQLDESLTRLQVDHIDLLQFHEVNQEEVPRQLYSQGPLEQALMAREQGKIRYIGFTGHRWPHLFQQMIAFDFPWDTVLMPVNLLDATFRSFQREFLPQARERGMGIIAIKSLAAGNLLKTGVTPQEAIRYSLSQPIDVQVTGIDSMGVLAQNLAIARSFTPMPEAEQQELIARVATDAADGHLEQYKTK